MLIARVFSFQNNIESLVFDQVMNIVFVFFLLIIPFLFISPFS